MPAQPPSGGNDRRRHRDRRSGVDRRAETRQPSAGQERRRDDRRAGAERRTKARLQDAPNIVAAIMEEAAEKAVARAEAQKATHKRRGRALIVLVPVFLLLTGWNLIRGTRPPDPIDDAAAVESTQMAVYLAAGAALAFRDSTGTPPQSLRELGLGDVRVRYVREGREFSITGTSRSQTIRYDSQTSLEEFVRTLDLPEMPR